MQRNQYWTRSRLTNSKPSRCRTWSPSYLNTTPLLLCCPLHPLPETPAEIECLKSEFATFEQANTQHLKRIDTPDQRLFEHSGDLELSPLNILPLTHLSQRMKSSHDVLGAANSLLKEVFKKRNMHLDQVFRTKAT